MSRLIAGSFGCLGVMHGSVAEGAAEASRTPQPRRSNSTPPKRCASCPRGAAPRCRSAAPAMSTARCTCGSKAARVRWRRRVDRIGGDATRRGLLGRRCANSACRSSTIRGRSGVCRCRTIRRSNALPGAAADRLGRRAALAQERCARRDDPADRAVGGRSRDVLHAACRERAVSSARRAALALSPTVETAARPARASSTRRACTPTFDATDIMQTNLSEHARTLPRADEAESILRSCVHCGFCNATCPTYQLLGNELRRSARPHLSDQATAGRRSPSRRRRNCISTAASTCRNCETTCPSGVTYHALLDIGRAMLERRVERPRLPNGCCARAARASIPTRRVFDALLKTGRAVRPFLPDAIRRKIPQRAIAPKTRPAPRHARRVLMLEGCVQPSLSPNTNAAAARVLDRLGISGRGAPRGRMLRRDRLSPERSGRGPRARCAATSTHGGPPSKRAPKRSCRPRAAAARSSRSTATCCATIPPTPPTRRAHQRNDARSGRSARRRAARCVAREAGRRIAFHCPCTLQHAQKLGGAVEGVASAARLRPHVRRPMRTCAADRPAPIRFTQPALAECAARRTSSTRCESGTPDVIATANIGCQTHLDGARPHRRCVTGSSSSTKRCRNAARAACVSANRPRVARRRSLRVSDAEARSRPAVRQVGLERRARGFVRVPVGCIGQRRNRHRLAHVEPASAASTISSAHHHARRQVVRRMPARPTARCAWRPAAPPARARRAVASSCCSACDRFST